MTESTPMDSLWDAVAEYAHARKMVRDAVGDEVPGYILQNAAEKWQAVLDAHEKVRPILGEKENPA